MEAVRRRRPKIGDVIEIPTPKGLGYAQYVLRYTEPPRYGALVCVLPGLHKKRPSDLSKNSSGSLIGLLRSVRCGVPCGVVSSRSWEMSRYPKHRGNSPSLGLLAWKTS